MLRDHLYPFLPLLLLSQRQLLKKAARAGKEQVNRLMKEAQSIVAEVERISRMLYDRDELDLTDFSKILLALQNLYAYLNRQYGGRAELEMEVNQMVKTLIDPEVWERGKEEGREQGREQGREEVALKMLEKGMSVADIKEITGLSDETIQKLNFNLA